MTTPPTSGRRIQRQGRANCCNDKRLPGITIVMGHETTDRLSFSTIPPQPADETKRIKRNCGDAFPARLPWYETLTIMLIGMCFLLLFSIIPVSERWGWAFQPLPQTPRQLMSVQRAQNN